MRGEGFGRILVDIVEGYAARYPQMDFADAVAQVFSWFDSRLSVDGDFTNRERFPTIGALRACPRVNHHMLL